MKKQSTQLIALVGLIVVWAVLWRLFIKIPPKQQPPPKPVATKTAPGESLLRIRFHRVRSEMDALYRYRTKPTPFDAQVNPYRIPAGMELLVESEGPTSRKIAKTPTPDAGPVGPITPDLAENVLKSAVAGLRFGGVVTLNGVTKVTIDGQLHQQGDRFTTKVSGTKGQMRTVILRIKRLSTSSATISLDESEAGGAEIRVRLN